MPRTSGWHDLWAAFAEARTAAGLPIIDDFSGANRIVPLAEANGDQTQLTEAATPADFPNALGNTLYRKLVNWAGQVQPEEQWRKYFSQVENFDFRPNNQILVAEMEDLLPVPISGEYKDSTMGDNFYQLQLSVFGRLFSVQRETIINDEIGVLNGLPEKMARAVARTKNKFFVRQTLEANVNAYDGTPFYSSNHNNLATGPGSALTGTSLQAAIYTMQTQVGDALLFPDGGPIQINPKFLVVPSALQFQARSLINSTLVVAAGGATPDVTFGNINPLQNMLEVVVDRWITSPTAWRVFADPAEVPGFVAANLRGKRVPDLLLERPYMNQIMGGNSDPYEIVCDKLTYKVRDQWAATGAAPWASYLGQGS